MIQNNPLSHIAGTILQAGLQPASPKATEQQGPNSHANAPDREISAQDQVQTHSVQGKSKANVSLDLNQSFVKNINGQFSLDGQPFRFVGTNMYSLAREKPEIQNAMLKEAAEQGFTTVRFWAYENYGATPEILTRLADMAQEHNLKLIPCLADRWVMSEEDLKNDHFYTEGYKRDYLPRTLEMTTALKDRPEIMMWELVNEPETEAFESMYTFSKTVSEAIKAENPNQLVSLGTIGGIGDKFGSQMSRFNTDNFKKLYSIPSLDAASIHNYSYDATVLERLDIMYRFSGEESKGAQFGKADKILSWASRQIDDLALNTLGTQIQRPLTLRGVWHDMNKQNIADTKALGKPLYVGEVGFKKFHGEDRKNLLRVDMANYIDEGVQGYTLWSFESQNRSIDGHDYGFKAEDHLEPVVREWNEYFAALAQDPENAARLEPPVADDFSVAHKISEKVQETASDSMKALNQMGSKLEQAWDDSSWSNGYQGFRDLIGEMWELSLEGGEAGKQYMYQTLHDFDASHGDRVPDFLYNWMD